MISLEKMLKKNKSPYARKTEELIDGVFKKSSVGVDKFGESGIIKTEIEKGNIKLAINHEKQACHIKGTSEYKEGKSYLTITEDEAQDIINAKSGTGKLIKDKDGKPVKEKIDCDKTIDIDLKTKEETPTDKGKIHYSKTGTHLVPRKETKKMIDLKKYIGKSVIIIDDNEKNGKALLMAITLMMI